MVVIGPPAGREGIGGAGRHDALTGVRMVLLAEWPTPNSRIVG